MFSLIREQTISTVDERRLKREVDATLRQGNQTRARRAAQESVGYRNRGDQQEDGLKHCT
jgi:hypothetical protein